MQTAIAAVILMMMATAAAIAEFYLARNVT